MNLFNIGVQKIPIPIIQGGMGFGISLFELSLSAVEMACKRGISSAGNQHYMISNA